MLQIITSVKHLNFRQLCNVYSDALLNAGKERYPDLGENRQLLEAEQDFYCFLSEFFKTPAAFYAIWLMDDCYKAALRIEPYKDGVLLAGLQTAPDSQNKGHASALIGETLHYLLQQNLRKVYSHIRKDNLPSIKCHEKNGFRKVLDYSVYINGDVDHHCHTYLMSGFSPA